MVWGIRISPSGRATVVLVTALLGVLCLVILAWLIHAPESLRSPAETDPARQAAGILTPPDDITDHATGGDRRGDKVIRVDDDGATLWASPTEGESLSLRWLPPGGQLFVSFRPAALLAAKEGRKVIDALPPEGRKWLNTLVTLVRMPLREIERLVISLESDAGSRLRLSLVVYPTTSVSLAKLAANVSGGQTVEQHGQSYCQDGDWAYFVPPGANGRLFVMTQVNRLADLFALQGSPPPLRRDVQRVAAKLDDARHISILGTASFFSVEARAAQLGVLGQALRDAFSAWLGPHVQAAALSAHWDRDFFLELRAAYTADRRPDLAARDMHERLRGAPAAVQQWLARSELAPYGRRVLLRLPAMLRNVASYTRSGDENRQAVLRCFLPAVAGHNLALAGQLLTLEASLRALPEAVSRSDEAPTTIQDKLAVVTSLHFGRETLQAALEQLAADVGVAIEMAGSDLELSGITKNQSLSLDLRNRTAREILVEILRAANPDKTAAGPADERQALVFVVRRSATGGPDVLIVTTRSAARARGERIESPFDRNE